MLNYKIKCSLGTDITADAKAMYVRLAGYLLPRLESLSCRLELVSTKQAFKPAWMPPGMDNYTGNYVAVFETNAANYATEMFAIFESLAQDFGVDYVDIVIDRGIGDPRTIRLDSSESFAEAHTKAYPQPNLLSVA